MERQQRATESCGCKVGRMIDAYELAVSNQQLIEWWTADDAKESLRDIADYFNQDLLRTELRRNGYSPLDGEIENVHRLLTDDDVSRGMETQTRKRLERQGIDVESLTDDFVSYQSIYRHLNECLGTEYTEKTQTAESRRQTGKERIFALENRTETVTVDTLSQLVDHDALALEEFDVLVDVSVTCLHCHRQHTIDELIENEGCQCRQSQNL
ncbi:rod-determining factor RdfA [Natronoglomus mannanivorans]